MMGCGQRVNLGEKGKTFLLPKTFSQNIEKSLWVPAASVTPTTNTMATIWRMFIISLKNDKTL